MENQSLNQMLNEQTRLNSENSIPTNTNIPMPMPIPLQMIIENYQKMFNILHLPSNLTGVLQSNVINRVGTLYKLFLEFLLPIISGLIDFTKNFISKSEEQDKKIASNSNVDGIDDSEKLELLRRKAAKEDKGLSEEEIMEKSIQKILKTAPPSFQKFRAKLNKLKQQKQQQQQQQLLSSGSDSANTANVAPVQPSNPAFLSKLVE